MLRPVRLAAVLLVLRQFAEVGPSICHAGHSQQEHAVTLSRHDEIEKKTPQGRNLPAVQQVRKDCRALKEIDQSRHSGQGEADSLSMTCADRSYSRSGNQQPY